MNYVLSAWTQGSHLICIEEATGIEQDNLLIYQFRYEVVQMLNFLENLKTADIQEISWNLEVLLWTCERNQRSIKSRLHIALLDLLDWFLSLQQTRMVSLQVLFFASACIWKKCIHRNWNPNQGNPQRLLIQTHQMSWESWCAPSIEKINSFGGLSSLDSYYKLSRLGKFLMGKGYQDLTKEQLSKRNSSIAAT